MLPKVTKTESSLSENQKIPKTTSYKTVSDKKFLDLVCEVDKKYSNALDKLANIP